MTQHPRKEIRTLSYEKNYTNYSFTKSVLTSAKLASLLENKIPSIGRWKSISSCLYIKTYFD